MIGPRLAATDAAWDALERARLDRGPHLVLLSWPSGATCLPAETYIQSPFEVVITTVAGCPVRVDLRQLALARHVQVLLDCRPDGHRARPVLLVRSVPGQPST